MTRIVPRLCAVAAAMVMMTGLAGYTLAQAPAPAAAGGPPEGSSQQQPPDSSAAGPTGAARPLEMPVLYVTSVEVLRSSAEPKLDLVRVTGLTSSQGWSGPTLVPFFYGKSADGILDLQFIATSPSQSQKADGFVPIGAIFTMEVGHDFVGVRVRASSNAIELKKMPGSAQVTIKTDSGKDVIGKKYVEKGQKGQGPVAAGSIHGEDLPRDYRVHTPTHGVKGIVHNPNRLNLILDDAKKVVMAFWE